MITSDQWRRCTSLLALKQLHASIIVHSFNSNFSNLRKLIFAAAVTIPSAITHAEQIFPHIAQPDLFMWNAIIKGLSRNPDPSNAVALYRRMEQQSPVSPNRHTFLYLLKACARSGFSDLGNTVHAKLSKLGLDSYSSIRNLLIYFHANCSHLNIAVSLFDSSAKEDTLACTSLALGYAKRGDLNAARKVFDKMPTHDLLSSNLMIKAYTTHNDIDSARKLFDETPVRNSNTYTIMINGYLDSKSHESALKTLDDMESHTNKNPNDATISKLLSSCGDVGDFENGLKIHRKIPEPSPQILDALIEMYIKCGYFTRALDVFHSSEPKRVAAWNYAILGLAHHGGAELSLALFNEMLSLKEVMPDEVTFTGALTACARAGRVRDGKWYFELMSARFGLRPNVRHYGCMVHMLGRAGLLQEAFEFVEGTGVEFEAVWRILWKMCAAHGDNRLEKRAKERLIEMDRVMDRDYLSISNMYVHAAGGMG